MEENRDQIIADFQSCTGIDDVGECYMHLEASNWNLLSAIHTVMPDESQTLPSERDSDIPMEVASEPILPSYRESINSVQPKWENSEPLILDEVVCLNDSGPSLHRGTRTLNFKVHYKDSNISLEVPETETVASIKGALYTESGVAICRQDLKGWQDLVPNNIVDTISDETVLSSLHLPIYSNLYLYESDPSGAPSVASGSSSDSLLKKNYTLHVIDFTNSKEYDLTFPGSKTVLEVKLGLQDITNIPVRFQQWTGWPDTAKDENIKLATLDLDSPFELILSRDDSAAKPKKQLVVELTSSESSESDFEDAAECFGVDDDMFHTGSTSKKIVPLIPEGMESEAEAVQHFVTEFSNRYGTCHPPFFQGTLADALQASSQKSARERHPLCVYLHHDASVLTNVFCTQLLCSESVVSYLTLNFMTWAWDLSQLANESRVLGQVSALMGAGAANAIRNLTLDNLPALMIVSKVRFSACEVLTVIPGNVGLDELMTRLLHAVDVFNNDISMEIHEEEEREARELVKREQDAAYEESLMADRAKEEARRQDIEEKQRKDMEEQREKEEQEQIRQEQEELKKAMQKSLADQLSPEPEEGSPLPVSHIRVRLPNGVTIARRFLASEPLDLLLAFIGSQGYLTENYKVLASWPRRDLSTLDGSKTLEELKLFPKETLTLEEK